MEKKPIAFGVDEVWPITPLSRNGFYEAIRKNDIPHIKAGRRILIPAWWVERLRNGTPPEAA